MPSKAWSNMSVGFRAGVENVEERSKVLDGFHSPLIASTTLMDCEKFDNIIWEPAAGFHKIAKPFREAGFRVYTSDIYDWHPHTHQIRDFADYKLPPKPLRDRQFSIITNPPFVQAQMFVEQAMELLPPGGKLALLLRLQFVEGNARYHLFKKYPPVRIHVYSFRLPRMRRFLYHGKESGSVLCFCWIVWKKDWQGKTELRWIQRPEL